MSMWPFKKRVKSKVNWLKKLRWEAEGKLGFEGVWSGNWTTTIMGVHYRSYRVCSFDYCAGNTGTFIQNAIIDRCKLLRDKEANEKAIYFARCGQERYINNGRSM